MKTKEIIEMLTSWSNDCHVWFDFDGHKANAAILLREAAHKLKENAVQEHEIEVLKKRIVELRKELAERKDTPGWISVEERLPEKQSELCLVYRKTGDICLSVHYCEVNHYWNYGDVTHWMPIPEPPEPPKPKVKTYKDVFLKAFPKADTIEKGMPRVCRLYVFGSDTLQCEGNCSCEDCWNQPYPEEEGGAE